MLETPQDRQIIADISIRELEVESPKKQITECLKSLCRNYLQNLKQDLEQKATNAHLSDDKRLEIMKERRQIQQALSKPFTIEI